MSLVKSRQRVADHGEVFTPAWLVEAMLDTVKHESERIDSRILEPACGSGNFLVPTLQRKLATVEKTYGQSDFERRHHALLSLMCTYGIELLEDNLMECRANLLEIFTTFLGVDAPDDWYRAGEAVLAANIVNGDALTMADSHGGPITFPEWAYRGKGKFQRRDFRFDELIQMSSFGEGTLFASMDKREIFLPVKNYHPMTVREVAGLNRQFVEDSEANDVRAG